MADKLADTRCRSYLRLLTSSNRNPKLCRAVIKQILAINSDNFEADLKWTAATCDHDNFMDMVRLSVVRHQVNRGSPTSPILTGAIKTIVQPRHFLEYLTTTKFTISRSQHEEALAYFKDVDLKGSDLVKALNDFIQAHAARKTGNLISVIAMMPTTERSYFDQLIDQYDGPNEMGAFEVFMNGCPDPNALVALIHQYLENRKCLAVLNALTNLKLLKNKELQVKGFERWVSQVPTKYAKHFNGNWAFIGHEPRRRQ
ncbi:MAG: hypothetical protein ACI97A_000515 [Planctomycetota bacterium]